MYIYGLVETQITKNSLSVVRTWIDTTNNQEAFRKTRMRFGEAAGLTICEDNYDSSIKRSAWGCSVIMQQLIKIQSHNNKQHSYVSLLPFAPTWVF